MNRYFAESTGWKTKAKNTFWLVSLFIFTAIASQAALAITEAEKKNKIVEILFNLPPGDADNETNHDYNDYTNCPRDWCTIGKSGYRGGHAGWDVQTQSVAGACPTVDEYFYSLTDGQVISAGQDANNTIAVYNRDDKTTLYLHARRIFVSEGPVKVGDLLGIQGNKGLNDNNPCDKEHVHIEVRKGYRKFPSNGIKDGTTIDPVRYLYESVNNARDRLKHRANAYRPKYPGCLRGDVNRDGQMDPFDQIIFLKTYLAFLKGETITISSQYDVNCDGEVDMEDYEVISAHWDDLSVALTYSVQNLLEDQTRLLTNYPNPFNPETWIPYQLAWSEDVSISIHAADGTEVRTLDLGHRPAGLYLQRNRAAYWDGRNTLGQEVASGIYFYTLSAGDFTTTRRMLIKR